MIKVDNFVGDVSMRVLTSVRRASSVKGALLGTIDPLNQQLSEIPGHIAKMEAEVGVGMAGATARITLIIDETEMMSKILLWANEAGVDENSALINAESKLNKQLHKIHGQIAGFYLKYISPPVPRRTYATIIVAVNEKKQKSIGKMTAAARRERLTAMLNMMGNNSRAMNLSGVAKLFGVSRDVIYEDLRKIGAKR